MTRLSKLLSSITAVGLVVLLTSLAAAQDEDQPAPSDAPDMTPQAVGVTLTDFKLDPAAVTAASGPISFSLTNRGVIDHNFAIENAQRQIVGNSPTVSAGGTTSFDVTLAPGTYTMVCTLPAHREAGMVGSLTVN